MLFSYKNGSSVVTAVLGGRGFAVPDLQEEGRSLIY